MTENQRYPNILQAIWILILLHILSRVLLILWYSFARVTGFLLLAHPAVMSLIYVVVFGLILMRGLKRANTSFGEICPLVPVRLSLLFPMALTIIGTFSLLEIGSWLDFFPSPSEWYPEWYTDFLYNLVVATNDLVVYPMWVMGVDFVIIGPLTEELLMRGLILRGFLSRYSVRKAILASALLSGLMHLNSWNLIGTTILGILLAWWFIQTRSMLPCFLGHALYGALFVYSDSVLGGLVEIWPPLLEIWFPLWWNLVGVILTALGIWLLIRQFRKSSDTIPEDVSGDKPDQL
ncbi:hypothetical protein C6502_16130 [Candidatus Poribacteria bacterium]|nr:MAG: hypothetical protein C6502_16130 [Candidatus Poribacteria bacterium]